MIVKLMLLTVLIVSYVLKFKTFKFFFTKSHTIKEITFFIFSELILVYFMFQERLLNIEVDTGLRFIIGIYIISVFVLTFFESSPPNADLE